MSAQWELDLERATQATCDDAYAKRQERDETLLAQVRESALDADRRKFETLKAADPCCVHLSPVLYPCGHFCACGCHHGIDVTREAMEADRP